MSRHVLVFSSLILIFGANAVPVFRGAPGSLSTWGVRSGTAPRRSIVWFGPYRPAAEDQASVAQLRANPGLFDAVYVGGCGLHVDDREPMAPVFFLNQTEYQTCSALLAVAKDQGLEIQMWPSPEESNKVIPRATGNKLRNPSDFNSGPLTESFVKLARAHGWAGINFDDESWATCKDFVPWLDIVNVWAHRVHQQGLKFSLDIQFATCPVHHEKPCDAYGKYPCLGEMYARSEVDEFIEMDTYYFDLARFYSNLDWYLKYFPKDKLGIGTLPNANPQDMERWLARFYAIEKSGAALVGTFRLPINSTTYLGMLWKWRKNCDDCPDPVIMNCQSQGYSFPARECPGLRSKSVLALNSTHG